MEKIQLLVADRNGDIYNHPDLEAAGMKGGSFFRLAAEDLIKLPAASALFRLPGRRPVGYCRAGSGFAVAAEGFDACAAFVSPGYVVTHTSAYREAGRPKMLPLFSYAACALYKGEYYAACIRVERERRHDPRLIDMGRVRSGIKKLRKVFPANRLVRHLEDCALKYACPGAQNFFLSRYEGPLPTSPVCNAGCMGCISCQRGGGAAVTQPRIKFRPTAREVAQVALHHIGNVADPVVSFGQGCEGEPLLESEVIEESIRLIRKATSKGIVNMNTNASRPKVLSRLFNAGLDSIRVSMSSVREEYYTRYYKPRDYRFKDVLRSIEIAKKSRRFVSINYLTMPGFTDSKGEFAAFEDFVKKFKIDMIQWRNLNYDPARYFEDLDISVGRNEMLGVGQIIEHLRRDFPNLMMGYYNPSRRRITHGTRPNRKS
jgi:pyruvate-formate lyase-activating enzyme